MKALEILNTLRDDFIDCYERGFAKQCDWKHIDEAIAELEALQVPKTCDGCIYYSVDDWNDFVCKHTIPCSRYCDDYYKQRCNK